MRKYMMAAIALLIAVPAWGAYDAVDTGAVSLTVEAYATVSLSDLNTVVMDVDGTLSGMIAKAKTIDALVWSSNAPGSVTLSGGNLFRLASPPIGWVAVASVPDVASMDAALTAEMTWTALIQDGGSGFQNPHAVAANASGVQKDVWVIVRGADDWTAQDAGNYSGTLTATISVAP